MHPETKNPLFSWLNRPNDDKSKTIIVAILLSLICSLMVATSAVVLKPKQQANKQLEIQKNILAVASIVTDKKNIEAVFSKNITVKLVDIESGNYVDHPDPVNYDWRKALNDPEGSIALDDQTDIADIYRRPKLLPVYLAQQDNKLKYVIIPVYGYGLWSTLYGFLALEPDTNTVAGLSFYEHAETPGLGGEVDNPKWRQQWQGKLIYDEQGEIKLEAIRGHVNPNSQYASFQVDGLSGATLTTRGVNNLIHFWVSDDGFGPYLKHIREERR